MLKRMLSRFFIGLCFALPAGLVVVAVGQASPYQQDQPLEDCQECHEIIRTHWEDSAHGNALSNPAFQEAWARQANSESCLPCHTTGFDPEAGTWEAEGITCVVCHHPVSENHPEQIMPTDVSSRLCGGCHLDTYDEWADSAHAQEDLACVRCHSPHTASLKATDTQELCRACHNEEVHFYSYTAHFQEGLLCTDCHLRVTDTQPGEGHGQRMHTFTVGRESCGGECHGDEMHFYISEGAAPDTPEQAGMAPLIGDTILQSEPDPVSPMGFATLAGLLGMAFGMILAPWLERWFQRLARP